MTTGPLSREEMTPLREVQDCYLRHHDLICEISKRRQDAIFSGDASFTDEDVDRVAKLMEIAHGLQALYDATLEFEAEYEWTPEELRALLGSEFDDEDEPPPH